MTFESAHPTGHTAGRRHFLQSAVALGMGGYMMAQAPASAASGPATQPKIVPPGTLGIAGRGPDRLKIAMLVFPKMVMQDLIGPLTVFNQIGAEIHLVWKSLDPVSTEVGIPVTPSTRFEDCPDALDVLFSPGGLEGTIDAMQDPDVIAFLRHQGQTARYVTSDCTGSLILGAAGLLEGYKAASHWTVRDQLSHFGAIPMANRVVQDRNRLTGGGVTAGIDFGLTLAALLRGQERAESIQLTIEYAPEPPFNAGRPETAPPAVYQGVKSRRTPVVERARAVSARIGSDLAKAKVAG
ncbi:DJ-1/PfpI family protein [Sphingobium subterraneum]|uniref:Cyclohexyl-isocyanide hydratase n=1 Tax=Sphingobium subterraneum TaxID=627688 RepID=A0A841J1K3_9SPHN|nr:DJ-1/PfpI family protein [Sphingobium subterraneum]MBB6123416.1 cyclohexyl-isocyanide hydratase [Sphingobium subterraneum]